MREKELLDYHHEETLGENEKKQKKGDKQFKE